MEGANIPSFGSLDVYSVNRAGEYEGVRQSLYDFQTYAQAGQTSLTFFQIPQGQGGKTIHDTNMEVAGSLPAPKHFLVQSIEIYLFPNDAPVTISNAAANVSVVSNFTNDIFAVAESGALDFFVGSKSYLQEAPLGRFPPKTKLRTEFAAALQVDTASAENAAQITMDYASFDGRPYFINPWVLLTPTQNFNLKLTWPTAVALSADARIGLVLDGILYRLSQ